MAPAADHALVLPGPFAADAWFSFVGDRAVQGAEHCDDRGYRRTLRTGGGDAIVEIRRPSPSAAMPTGTLPDGTRPVRTVPTGTAAAGAEATTTLAVAIAGPAAGGVAGAVLGTVSRLVGGTATDPVTVDAALAEDPLLAPLVARRGGLRVPGTAAAHELVVRAVIGQQVSVAGARTVAARLTAEHGELLRTEDPEADPARRVLRLFPTAERLAALEPDALPMPRARGRCLIAACRALAEGSLVLDPDGDVAEAREALLALPGIGPWTADYILLRTAAAPDVFLATDLAVRRAARRLGLPDEPRALARRAERWAPWRSHATMHLWCSLGERPVP
jgi:AraC family transcriptional regulator of adaptative response / DNA-3-methyladenine glycosylase II